MPSIFYLFTYCLLSYSTVHINTDHLAILAPSCLFCSTLVSNQRRIKNISGIFCGKYDIIHTMETKCDLGFFSVVDLPKPFIIL